MKLPSLRRIIKIAPRPLRKLVRHKILPVRVSERAAQLLGIRETGVSNDVISPVTGQVIQSSKKLELKLWGGFSQHALRDLQALKANSNTSKGEVAAAARTLCAWYASHAQPQAALKNATVARLAHPKTALNDLQVILESESLLLLGRNQSARRLLDSALERRPKNPHLLLALANTYTTSSAPAANSDDRQRLALLNKIYENAGLATLVLKDESKPLALSNISGRATPTVSKEDQPKITVLIPAYCCCDTLEHAVESLLAQSWQNLEIIIVDDQSPDATFELARRLAAEHPQVIALRQEQNSGSYAARNLALQHATGEYITVHDADDWSHPQKLEQQFIHLKKKRTQANISDWVRCLPHLYFKGGARIGKIKVIRNHSSLLVSRKLLLTLGGWDEVRISADVELIKRLEASLGISALPRAHVGIPLAFALEQDTSLTRQGPTHVFTLTHGIRRDYHESARYWRETQGASAGWKHQSSSGQRDFPAPDLMLKDRAAEQVLDLLVIMDFGIEGGAYVSTKNYIDAAVSMGLRVGVFHWRRYDLNPTRAPAPEILELLQSGKIFRVSPSEKVTADTIVVGYPVILNYPIDRPPQLTCQRVAIITNQMNARLYSGGDVQYEPSSISQQIEQWLGRRPVWIPISELVRELMETNGNYAPISSDTWTPLIQTSDWFERKLKWKNSPARPPIIGRHARDHYTKWPESPEAIKAAYCANQPCEVHLLGGAAHALTKIQKCPSNWVIHEFGSMPAMEFLSGLDFFVHFPLEDYIEEFGRAVLEAMAAGVPAILPPVFKSTFKDAALYAEPETVWSLVERIWNSEEAYLERAREGRRFVAENSDWTQMPQRLERLRSGS